MNFLGHAVLSGKHPEILAGNMMGDYFKGKKALQALPENIRRGIMLHRSLDAFTDNHLAVKKASHLFRPAYRLYAKAILDHIWDHFLANDPEYFSSEPALLTFTLQVYTDLEMHGGDYFPKGFRNLFTHMKTENWMYDIRSQRGLKKSLNRMQYRARYLGQDMEEAYRIFIQHYYELNQLFFDFIDDISHYVKKG